MSIRHAHLLNPITGLEFFIGQEGKNLILAGEGSFLKVFEAETGTSTLVSQFEIFNGQTIHGIAVREAVDLRADIQVVIWGGPFLVQLTKADFELLLTRKVCDVKDKVSEISDWILDVAISPYGANSCAIVTAHNTILRARSRGPGQSLEVDSVASPCRSILYSAHLIWESSDCVLVAAGTVFGEIIVWRCTLGIANQIIFTFTGHEGSIFGVNISPPIKKSRNGLERLLVSCSDDRTIRVWDLSADPETTMPPDSLSLLQETEFGDNMKGSSPNATERCLATVMAHASRIWRVKFSMGQCQVLDDCSIRLLSFGEDATANYWELDLKDRLNTNMKADGIKTRRVTGSLRHLGVFAFHSGKQIWSAAVGSMNGNDITITTGGADGKISLYSLGTSRVCSSLTDDGSLQRRSGDSKSCSWELDEIYSKIKAPEPKYAIRAAQEAQDFSALASSPATAGSSGQPSKKKPKNTAKDSFNRYAFISKSQVLLTTNFGKVFLGKIEDNLVWTELSLPESATQDLMSYVVVKSFLDLGVAFLAGANGAIYSYQDTELLKVADVHRKVAEMFQVVDSVDKTCHLLVTTLGGNFATMFSLDGSDPHKFSAREEYSLPEKFAVTSAGKNGNTLILGSRFGFLARYEIGRTDSPTEIWKPKDRNAADAITTILFLPSDPTSNTRHFLTTERNGQYSVFRIDEDSAPTIRDVHHGTPPLGPMIEAAWFDGRNLLLYGFKGKNFVVWNETEQCEIMNVDCGGAHRSYVFTPLPGGSGAGHFLYTKASKLYLYSCSRPSHQVVKQGGHGREIKACAVSCDGLIATGAEDTVIRIWRYEDGDTNLSNRFDCQKVIQRHTAGIQHLQWHGSKYLFSSGGTEEFYVWAIEMIPSFGIGVVCEAPCPDASEDKDLRIMSFDVSDAPGKTTSEAEGSLLISLAYSDSTIKTYTYSKTNGFDLLLTGQYTSACLTQIRHIKVSEQEIYILTAATDGRLNIWKASMPSNCSISVSSSGTFALLTSNPVHQSAIKCLSIIDYEGYLIVATGGDDNALGLSVYDTQDLTRSQKSCVLRSAHAAAITGLTFAGNAGEKSFRLTSSSNDQRVKKWVVRTSGGGASNEVNLSIDRVGDEFTSIADVGEVVLLDAGDGRSKKVMIVGNGMEVWNI